MSTDNTGGHGARLELEYELDASPAKVWRAISIPEFRQCWLPDTDLAGSKAAFETPFVEIGYKIRNLDEPTSESLVTFKIAPSPDGGTSLRIIHERTSDRLDRLSQACANSNTPALLRAA